ncbi:7 transmembrane sweet-taste receptor of 3 GCPR-domain-containing protein [Paraphysoderma sedebokerense]|nr:7 transmembrane sweet-taste receptor of 3 GCPR-domain-containing protein [Paraphysoderma sedebokerense]
MWCTIRLFLLISVALLPSVHAAKTIRVGTYFTTNSSIGSYVSETQALHGVQFWVHYVNNVLKGLEVNGEIYLIDHINVNTNALRGNATLVSEAVKNAVEADTFDFVIGGHTSQTVAVSRALNDSTFAQVNNILQIQCCTGPRSVYAPGYTNVFGVHLPADIYSYPFLRYIKTLGHTKVFMLISDEAAFTITTGAAAVEFARSNLNLEVIAKNYTYGPGRKSTVQQLVRLLEEGRDTGAEVLLTFGLNEDGILMTNALQNLKHDWRHVFITVAPTEPGYLNANNSLAGQYVMSPTQWHYTMGFESESSSFPGSKGYTEEFRKWMTTTYNSSDPDNPTYQLAILKANTVNRTEVRQALRNFNANTFFGKMQMDRNQRNIGRDSAVLQIIESRQYAVLPTGFADFQPQLPALWQARLGCVGDNSALSRNEKYCLRSINEPISSDPGFVATSVVAILMILLTIACSVFIHLRRNHQYIKAISPFFCHISLFGIIVCFSNAFLFSGIPDEKICIARPFVGTIGFGLLYSAILAKSFRIYKIFEAKTVNASPIPIKMLLAFVTTIVGAEILISAIWVIVDQPKPTKIVLSNDQNFIVECVSAKSNAAFSIITYVFNGLLVLIGAILAWKTREVYSTHNESKSVALSIYNILLSFLIGLTVIYAPSEPSRIQFIIQNFLIFIPTTITLVLLFGIRIAQVLIGSPVANSKPVTGFSGSRGTHKSGFENSGVNGVGGQRSIAAVSLKMGSATNINRSGQS